MSNPFASLSSTGLEETTDTLGGFTPFDSNVYDAIIKIAFAGQSAKGARSVTFHFELDGREHRETIYVTNRNGENWYPNKKDASKKMPLPGFSLANNIALLATGFELGAQELEERVIKLWDKDASAEINTKVQALVGLIGKPVKLGMVHQIVDKNVDDGTGRYVPSGETREESVINAVFHAETSQTVNEVKNKITPAEFIEKWKAKYVGTVVDKSTKNVAKTGRPGAASGTAPKSMFS